MLDTKLIRKHIRDRKYTCALEMLQDVDSARLSRTEYGEYLLLRARVSMRIEASTSVSDDIETALGLFRHGPETGLFSEGKYIKGLWLSTQGQHSEARDELMEAYAGFLRCCDTTMCAATLNRLAYCCLQVGEVQVAIRNLEKCLNAYIDADDRTNSLSVRQNLSALRLRSGQISKSQDEYAELRLQLSAFGSRSRLIFYATSALPQALQGDIKTTRRTIAEAEPYLDDYPRERAIYLENLGLINILDGKHAAAEKALKEGLELSLEIAPESALVSQIKRLFGDLYVATEKWAKAEQSASEALEVAEKIGQRVEIAACWRIYGQIDTHRGKDDKAREWFSKAIELFQAIGSNYELAVTRYLAGVSGLYHNGERQAPLWMARQYFDSEQVKPSLRKIDKALSDSTVPRTKKRDGLSVPVIIAKSKVMTDIIAMAENVASANMNVLLTGATGTGKDLLAKYIHHHSGREGEFVSVNAAAIPGPMIEAELFGNTKGAFTDSSDRMGLMEQAHKGTFYLNEVADATMEFQAKLLEVLENRTIRRLGENKNRPVDFRLIAATNHDLKQRIAEGKFRLDLYHRLGQIPIELPPLSDRPDDIPHLVAHFLSNGSSPDGALLERLGFLMSCLDYEGNIRDLKNRVEMLSHTTRGDVTQMIDLLLENTLDRKSVV